MPLPLLTSFGVACTGALTGARGLVTEAGLEKAESRPEKCKPVLASLPLGFQGPVCWGIGNMAVKLKMTEKYVFIPVGAYRGPASVPLKYT